MAAASRLDKELRDALLSFDPVLGTQGIRTAAPRPTYNTMRRLRRRGLAVCEHYSGNHRGIFGYRWKLTDEGERALRAILGNGET